MCKWDNPTESTLKIINHFLLLARLDMLFRLNKPKRLTKSLNWPCFVHLGQNCHFFWGYIQDLTLCFVVSSYGWFSDHEPQRVSAVTPLHNCIISESIHKPIETTEERICLEVSAQVASTAHVVIHFHHISPHNTLSWLARIFHFKQKGKRVMSRIVTKFQICST